MDTNRAQILRRLTSSPWLVWALLAAALTGHLLVDRAVVDEDTVPLVVDRASFLVQSLVIKDVLAGESELPLLEAIAGADTIRPPLPALLGAASLFVGGNEMDTVSYVGMLALVLCALATFALGRHLAGAWAGLAGALLTISLPIIIGHSRVLMSDLLLCAAVVAGVLALWRAAERSTADRRWWAAWSLVGAAWSAGLLTKITFPIFLLGPVVLEIVRPRQASRKLIACGLALASAVAALLSAPWYGHKLGTLLDHYQRTDHFSHTMEGLFVLHPRSLGKHFGALPEDQAGTILALVGLAGLVLLLVRRPPGWLRLLTAWAVPWIIFTFIPLRTVRNTLPALPFFMLMVAVAGSSLGPRWRRLVLAGSCVLAVVHLVLFQFVPPAKVFFPPLCRDYVIANEKQFEDTVDRGILLPRKVPWWAHNLIQEVERDRPLLLGTLLDRGHLTYYLEVEARLRAPKLRIVELRPRLERARAGEDALSRLDHVVLHRAARPKKLAPLEARVLGLLRAQGWERLGSHCMPDGTQAVLYRRVHRAALDGRGHDR